MAHVRLGSGALVRCGRRMSLAALRADERRLIAVGWGARRSEGGWEYGRV